MKEKLTLFIILISIQFIVSQSKETNKLYITSELNLGNYIGVDLNLNFVTKKKYTLKIGYTGNLRSPKSIPKDYSSINDILPLSGPYDHFKSYQISFGKIYELNKKGTIRANLSFGLGLTTIRDHKNWLLNDVTPTSRGYYTWDTEKHNKVSLIINPKIEFPFTRFYGLTISPMIQINKEGTYFGIGVGQMIGLLTERKN